VLAKSIISGTLEKQLYKMTPWALPTFIFSIRTFGRDSFISVRNSKKIFLIHLDYPNN